MPICISILQAEARRCDYVRGLEKSWHWVHNQWVLENLVSLLEYDWKVVPPDVKCQVEGKFRGLSQSVVIEEGNKILEDATRETGSGQCSRKQRWQKLLTSNLLSEWDRKPLTIDAGAEHAAVQSLPKTLFTPIARHFSLGDALLESISHPSWSSPSPANADNAVKSTAAARVLEGDWTAMRKSILSCMAIEGHAMYRLRQIDSVIFVWSVSEYCFFGTKLLPKRSATSAATWFELPKINSERKPQLVTITDHSVWKVQPVKCVPCWSFPHADLELRSGFVLVMDGPPSPLLAAAARKAFPGPTVPQLERLFDVLEVPYTGRKPKTEATLLLALMKFALPEERVEVLKGLMKQRTKKDIPFIASELLTPGGLQHVTAFTHDGDRGDFEDAIINKTSSKGGSGSGARGLALAAALTTPPPTSELTAEYAKAMLPNVPCAHISREEYFQFRWRASYTNRPTPPFQWTKRFNPQNARSLKVSLAACLTEVWLAHFEATGEACPYDFEKWVKDDFASSSGSSGARHDGAQESLGLASASSGAAGVGTAVEAGSKRPRRRRGSPARGSSRAARGSDGE